ncbi:LysR family transcriptional regulator [Methylobacterium bullatum]|uniref:Hydrogen peroxide-inducible genes activator n=1 Tax=Methylobacterium bullatum TaxID=570505 RepID=A0AAV4ZA42_9HYPH|nr:LysR substrate-binding domain-containing protein [Methylobacterium bullatum]MBD8900651.1 LysR family transcriptional regulator [Methylobacterium bullatum]GJD40850.1 Hydrogen peroxide-inducible genes activator [Methylobacterium bullatum]
MDLRQLRYFVQIAESGNVSRAAEVLSVAQPSLSQQIRNLEDELGVELFFRHARGVTPTEQGLTFYEHARRILHEVERAKDTVRSQATSPSGRISIGLPTSACRGLSLPLYEEIAKALPNITLHIVEAMSGTLDEWIQAGRLDVALLYDHKAFEHVAWTEMMIEDLMLIMPSRHPIACQDHISFQDVFRLPLPLVLPGRPNILRVVIEQLAARHEVTPTAIDCESLPAIAELVRSKKYAAIMPHFALSAEIARGEMVAIPIVDPTPSWRLSVVVSQRTLNVRGSEGVAKVLASVIAKLVESNVWRAKLKTHGKLPAVR